MAEAVTKKLMLFFPRCECEKPIIYHLVKNHNLVVNVLRAKVTPEEQGYLVLDVTGSEEQIMAAFRAARDEVEDRVRKLLATLSASR